MGFINKVMHVDLETYSSKDIGKCGLYNYVQATDFGILLFAYAFDDQDVKIIDLAQGEQLPQELITALSDNSIVKTAYNAAFEWYCLSKFWYTPIEQWRCTMIKGLYCGYPAGLAAVGNAMGLSEKELPEIVERWRSSNKRIVDLWQMIQNCSLKVLQTGQKQCMQKGISFNIENGNLAVTLPSGRKLFYIRPELITNQFGQASIAYMGQNQTTKKWEKIPTYGGKMTENIVQAIARDCLAVSIKNLVVEGYRVVFSIHDEIIAEVPENDNYLNLDNAINIMCKPIEWAEGLPLNADGFTSRYYKKE